MAKMNEFALAGLGYSPDASLGLIYRINRLWHTVDIAAMSGDFDRWNILLDRVFCNLLYKNELEVTRDDNQEITEAKLNEEDFKLWEKLNKSLLDAKENFKKAKTKDDYLNSKDEIYKALMLKDIGLRKFMHNRLKIYMKEKDSNPARAMWGG